MSEPIEVSVPCNCPDSPHDADTVYLAPALGMAAGLAVEAAMTSSTSEEAQTFAVSLALVRHNILGWTFVDENGIPVPVNAHNIDLMLPYARGGEEVANRAARLYTDDAFGPLARRVRGPSQKSRTNGQTRPILASHAKPRRKSSGSSSRAGSAGTP